MPAPIVLKFRRGTTAQHVVFTGADSEVTVDSTKKTLVVHDGVTPGGTPLATEAQTLTGSQDSVVKYRASSISGCAALIEI